MSLGHALLGTTHPLRTGVGSPVPHCPQDSTGQRREGKDLRLGRDNSPTTGDLLPKFPGLALSSRRKQTTSERHTLAHETWCPTGGRKRCGRGGNGWGEEQENGRCWGRPGWGRKRGGGVGVGHRRRTGHRGAVLQVRGFVHPGEHGGHQAGRVLHPEQPRH